MPMPPWSEVLIGGMRLGGAMVSSSSATVMMLAAGGKVRGGDHWVGLIVLLEPHLVG